MSLMRGPNRDAPGHDLRGEGGVLMRRAALGEIYCRGQQSAATAATPTLRLVEGRR
jgi:hypothetical protein